MKTELRKIKSKKGQVGGLSSSIISLGVAAIILVIMIVILQEMRDVPFVGGGANVNDTAFVAINETVVGMGTFADFWTIIVLAIIAAVVIGIIFGAFGGVLRQGPR